MSSVPRKPRSYRELLFTTPGAAEFISGVHSVYRRNAAPEDQDGTPFAEYMNKQAIIPGIKVDAGAKLLALSPGNR